MVRRKATRQLPKSKPKKPDVSIMDDDDEERKENLLKRLDDFDMQVMEILQKMESDKQSVIASIKHLYFVDEQRTPSDTNDMLWTQFLKQNTPNPESLIRKSIADLVNKAEDPSLTKKTTNRKRKGKADETPTPGPAPATTRATRSRATKNVLTEANVSVIETPAGGTQRSKKGGISKVAQSTPMNQNIPPPITSLLITPKFDPRTPLPMHTLRKPKFGEIAISLKGSPLQVAPKNYSIGGVLDSVTTDKSREQLQEIHRKVSELLRL